MNAIVGYTGFVGSNLYTPERFGAAWNSRNIAEAYGTEPDLLVYAGVRAEKFLANRDPEKDLEKFLRKFIRRFFSQQFKRSCMPDGPKVGSISLSPRADWRMPSDSGKWI